MLPGVIPLTESLPQGGYYSVLEVVLWTAAAVAIVLIVYRMWLAACRDRRDTRRWPR